MINNNKGVLLPQQQHQQHQVPNFCSRCGSDRFELVVPPNDERVRPVCSSCQNVVYANPKVVVSCVVLVKEVKEGPKTKCLLAKRAIEPRRGYWGIPQGYVELDETTREAAVREVYEETGVVLPDPSALQFRGLYNLVPHSVQLLYLAELEAAAHQKEIEQQIRAFLDSSSSSESSDVALFDADQISDMYDDLCFPTVKWALRHCLLLDDNDVDVEEEQQQQEEQNYRHYSRIQQKTKCYNYETERWDEYEDEGPPPAHLSS